MPWAAGNGWRRPSATGATTGTVEPAEAFEGCDHDLHPTVNRNHGRSETRRGQVLGRPAYIRSVDPDGTRRDRHCRVLIEAQRRQGELGTSATRDEIPTGGGRGPATDCAPPQGRWEPPARGPGQGLAGGWEPLRTGRPEPRVPRRRPVKLECDGPARLSVTVDFRCVYNDSCPIPIIIQASGRFLDRPRPVVGCGRRWSLSDPALLPAYRSGWFSSVGWGVQFSTRRCFNGDPCSACTGVGNRTAVDDAGFGGLWWRSGRAGSRAC